MLIEMTFELPAKVVLELGYDGRRVLSYWEKTTPGKLSAEEAEQLELAYHAARRIFCARRWP